MSIESNNVTWSELLDGGNSVLTEQIAESFRKSLNAHGHGFHFAILRKINEWRRAPYWKVRAAEFGVTVQGRDTKIDLLIEKGNDKLYLVGECKRANPAMANWCFAKSSWFERYGSMTYVEAVHRRDNNHVVTSRSELLHSDRAYQIAMDIRTDHKGEASQMGRGGIEDAISQVCRSTNGFIDWLGSNSKVLLTGKTIRLLPVVFTTARLFCSETDVGDADIEKGELPAGLVLKEMPWLWCDYPQSPGLKHALPTLDLNDDLDDHFRKVSLRRVAIVSASGVEAFLESQLWM